ncbi:MAG: YfiR family protein [Mariprofundus sp.]|nr:YfiR family protein [Mariprofundus sp.]
MRRSFLLLCGGLIVGMMNLATGSMPIFSGEPVKAGVNDLKAVYIINFIRFTDWPGSEIEPSIQLKLPAAGELQAVLQAIAAKPVAKQMNLHLSACSNATCVRKASALFIGKSSDNYKDWLAQCNGLPILTMSDIPGFARSGGMIEIKYDNNKLTFIVNVHAVRRAGLYISAQLLQLGEIVGRENE